MVVEFDIDTFNDDVSGISENFGESDSNTLDKLESKFDTLSETMTEADLEKLNNFRTAKKQAASIEKIKNKLNITDVDTAKRVYKLLNDVQTKSFIDTTTNEPLIDKLRSDRYDVSVDKVNTLREQYKRDISDKIRQKLIDIGLTDVQIDNIHKLVLDSLFKEIGKDHTELLEKIKTEYENKQSVTEDEVKKMREQMKKLESSLDEFDKKTNKSTLRKLLSTFYELLKIMIPIAGIWLLYNLISVALSRCYWTPVNKNCTFEGHNASTWYSNSTAKYDNILPQQATPSLSNKILFHGDRTEIKCECSSNLDNYFITYAKKGESYGTVLTENPADITKPFGTMNDATRRCNTENEDTVQCETDGGHFPMCIRQFDDTRDKDKALLNAHLKPPETYEIYTEPSVCTGKYQYYECDLSEMVNGLAKLVNDVLNFDPSGIFKKIILFVVAVVVFFLIISVIRMLIKRGGSRKQSFNGRGRGRRRR